MENSEEDTIRRLRRVTPFEDLNDLLAAEYKDIEDRLAQQEMTLKAEALEQICNRHAWTPREYRTEQESRLKGTVNRILQQQRNRRDPNSV